jgi:hypothetical protein
VFSFVFVVIRQDRRIISASMGGLFNADMAIWRKICLSSD